MLVRADEQRRIREQWEKRIAEYRASGQGVRQWSEANDVKPQQMWWWLRRVEVEGPEERPTKWVKAIVGGNGTVDTAEHIALLVRVGKADIEVKPGFDATLLCSVVRALSTIC